jgi:(2Fe-2S) ferredoxin
MTETIRLPDDPPLRYRAHIFICGNRRPEGHPKGCCAGKGSEDLRSYMKERVRELGLKRVRVNLTGCLARCEHGPCVVIYPEGVWYTVRSRADVNMILERHVRDGGRVPELLIPPE